MAELDTQIEKLMSGPWQTNKSRRAQVSALQRERNLLAARGWLDAKGAAVESKATALIAGSQEAMTRDAASRTGASRSLNFLQQVGASTLEGVVGLGGLAGRLAEFGQISAVEDAVLHRPVQTAVSLGRGVGEHVQDVYAQNGAWAALGDVSTLGLAGVGEARLIVKTLNVADRVTAPLPAAIASAVHATTRIAPEATLPTAKVAVKVLVGAQVAKETVKVVGATGATEVLGNQVRERTGDAKKRQP